MSRSQELLQIKPVDLRFHFELHKEIKCSFDITSRTNEFVAFKIKSTNPKKYRVIPNHGLLQPGLEFNIVVTMYAQTEALADMNCKDKFLVQAIIATKSTIIKNINDVTNIMKGPGKVHEVTLPVAYVQQAQVQETVERSMPRVHFSRPEPIKEGDEGEENEENEMETLSSSDVQKMKKMEEELAKLRNELEEKKNLVEELQQKMGYTEYKFEDLRKATDNFAKSIGKGGFSVVYKGIIHEKEVAIKKLIVIDEKGFKEEIETLSKVRHPNIITLVGACSDKENRVLVYEYLPNGSLEDHLMCKNKTRPLSGHTRIRIALDICSALNFLHCNSRVHADLKPDNVLLDSDFVGKLSDFGTSRKVKEMKDTMTSYHDTTVKGTAPYMDPAFLSSGKLKSSFDVYSFGVVLLRLATGKDVYDPEKSRDLKDLVEEEIEKNNFDQLVDDVEWPSKEDPEKMAKLGLQCFLPTWKGRPNAARLFKSLMDIATSK